MANIMRAIQCVRTVIISIKIIINFVNYILIAKIKSNIFLYQSVGNVFTCIHDLVNLKPIIVTAKETKSQCGIYYSKLI